MTKSHPTSSGRGGGGKGKSGGGKGGQSKQAGAANVGPTIENRKARHDYEILDTIETGIVLRGSEVKSVRDGRVSLAEGYVRVDMGRPKRTSAARPTPATGEGAPKPARKVRATTAKPTRPELYLHSVNIAEYAPSGPAGSAAQHIPTRVRKLLAHTREIIRLAEQVATRGMTLIPLKMYFTNGRAKVLVGVARGRAQHDKREAIAKRDAQRDIHRAMARKL